MSKKLEIFCSVSESYLEQVQNILIPSLLKQSVDLELELVLINYTASGNIYKGETKFPNLTIKELNTEKQEGFGGAHNYAFNKIKPEGYFLIINPDTYLHKDFIKNILNKMKSDEKIGLADGRQLPFSHPKEFNPQTLETPWVAGNCLMANAKCFEEIGGFDEDLWMYNEDVDLSWRAWTKGYKVVHIPEAVVYHYTGLYFGYGDNRYYIEHFWSARNFFYLMYKFFGEEGIEKAKKMIKKVNYPNDFVEATFGNFEQIKNKIKRIHVDKKLQKYIKVRGYNLFHLKQYEEQI